MQKLPISVFIITKNEEERLPACINSVKDWVYEIIVIDSGSTDKTEEIAKSFGAKFIFNAWNGYGAQKIFGENLCKNNWILNLDADEAISSELRTEIFEIFQQNPSPKTAYKMFCSMVFLGRKAPPKFLAQGITITRLYNKQYFGFRNSTVHDAVIPKEDVAGENISDLKVIKLKNIILHNCFKNLAHWMDKINFYTTAQADEWIAKGRAQPSTLRFIIEPFFAFFKSYFIRKYFVYGIEGFNASVFYAYSKTLRLAKIRENFKVRS